MARRPGSGPRVRPSGAERMKLRLALAMVGLSMTEAAKRVGLSQSYFQQAMSGRYSFPAKEYQQLRDLIGELLTQTPVEEDAHEPVAV